MTSFPLKQGRLDANLQAASITLGGEPEMHPIPYLTHRRLAFSLPLGGDEAQALIEYVLILSFISIGALITVAAFGGGLLAMWASNLTSLLSVL